MFSPLPSVLIEMDAHGEDIRIILVFTFVGEMQNATCSFCCILGIDAPCIDTCGLGVVLVELPLIILVTVTGGTEDMVFVGILLGVDEVMTLLTAALVRHFAMAVLHTAVLAEMEHVDDDSAN